MSELKRKYTIPPRDGCAGRESGSPDSGYDFDCDYEPDFSCDDCMYCKGRPVGTGRNPQAKCNQMGRGE